MKINCYLTRINEIYCDLVVDKTTYRQCFSIIKQVVKIKKIMLFEQAILVFMSVCLQQHEKISFKCILKIIDIYSSNDKTYVFIHGVFRDLQQIIK